MYLTIQELSTHLYGEQVEVISRGNDAVLTAAIDGAIAEIKSYLGGYDTEAIFGAEGAKRHPLLLIFAKDIAVWHFFVLANAGSDLELREKRYNDAKAWLKAVQKGDLSPDLPIKGGDGSTDGSGSSKPIGIYLHGSNSKRNQHY